MSSSPPTLTVCVIARDEEPNIRRVLESVRGVATEVVVLDTGSRDRTVAIAEELGARVLHFAWTNDFSEARNRVITAATSDWVLMLDADEAMASGFAERWPDLARTVQADGLCIPILDMDGEVLRQRLHVTRLFRRRAAYRYEGRIHEEIAPSILRAKGRIIDAELPIFHFGYSAEEDRRKDRRGRNLELLLREHEAHPEDPRVWHYLGLELLLRGELTRAASFFERVLDERPDAPLAGWSASLLADILRRQNRLTAAWKAASFGAAHPTGRVMGLVRLGELAIDEGDPTTADECANELESLPEGSHGDIPRRRAIALGLHASARSERGDDKGALTQLLEAVRTFPDDAPLADQFVRLAEKVLGAGKGALEAVRAAQTTFVAVASAGAFVRREQWTSALTLASRTGVDSVFYAHAHLRVGQVKDGLAMLSRLGASGDLHLLLWGLETSDRALVEAAKARVPAVAFEVASNVLDGTPVREEHTWLLWEWCREWLEFRGRALAARLIALAGPGDHRGKHALLLCKAGLPMEGLVLALDVPGDPSAQETLGRVAFASGDVAAAVGFFGQCARAGNASVRNRLARAATLLT